MAILFISGINDLSVVGLSLDSNDQLVQLMDGNCSIHGRVPLKNGIDAYVVLFGKGVKQPMFNFSSNVSLIFNQIADADTHRGSLERCIELCSRVPVPVINRPEAVLQTTRDRISEMLQGIPGVIMPRTLRFQPLSPEAVFEHAAAEEIDFPFIVRVAGDHAGKSMVLVKGREDTDALHVFPLDGRDYYLTEYVDCRTGAGLYDKQRFVVIGGEPVLRHWLQNDQWKIHGASRSFMLARETWEEDRIRTRWLETEMVPRLMPAFREIHARVGLEYFGLDCNVRPNGDLLIFEANANMNILHNPYPEMNERITMIHRKIQALLARLSGEVVV
jgi:glutathione synthase/RimK-type ligase-like ATP-grasp enzyme